MNNIALEKSRITLGPASRPLTTMWQHRWLGMAVTLGVAALAGLIVSLTMPRGPATAAQALVIMATGLVIGLAAGLASRSHWANHGGRPWACWPPNSGRIYTMPLSAAARWSASRKRTGVFIMT